VKKINIILNGRISKKTKKIKEGGRGMGGGEDRKCFLDLYLVIRPG